MLHNKNRKQDTKKFIDAIEMLTVLASCVYKTSNLHLDNTFRTDDLIGQQKRKDLFENLDFTIKTCEIAKQRLIRKG